MELQLVNAESEYSKATFIEPSSHGYIHIGAAVHPRSLPFTGETDTDDEGNVIEPYILGHRDGNYYHQWASIQIVGHDISLVLDALPKERGMSKDETVDALLKHATEMVDDITLVMMDREFDSDSVKNTCEEYGVYHLNPKRKFAAQNDTIAEMKRNDETVRIIEQPCEARPNRKYLFLPSTTERPNDEIPADTEMEPDCDDRPNYRQEMCEELGIDEADLGEEISPLAPLLSDLRRDDEDLETTDATMTVRGSSYSRPTTRSSRSVMKRTTHTMTASGCTWLYD